MISLENISIRYNKVLIKKSSMIIHDNSVTLIKGLSGSGKTTLLYRIGLISKAKKLRYVWDNINIHSLSPSKIDELQMCIRDRFYTVIHRVIYYDLDKNPQDIIDEF